MVEVFRKNIVLTGFMGTGKSTVGKLLAKALQRSFLDTDEIIESRQGMSVADIFSNQGESAFRQLEAALAEELGRQRDLVIATGGKMLLDQKNSANLGDSGLVICLVAPAATILSRVLADTVHRRPLLEVRDPQAEIERLLTDRHDGYGRYVQVDTSGKSPDEVAAEILQLVAAYNQ